MTLISDDAALAARLAGIEPRMLRERLRRAFLGGDVTEAAAFVDAVNAPALSAVACSPDVRTVTVAPATGAPLGSSTWPVTVARSFPMTGVSF